MNLDMAVDRTNNTKDGLTLALKVAKAIETFHKKDLAHGCLKPSHVLFDRSDSVVLNGCGFHSLKKYLSLITGYTNKSIYTAVEHLRDRNNVILKPKIESDVYSFGILLYEIVTRNRQYRDLPLKEIQVKFCDDHFRPKLPDSVDLEVKNLIRSCWHESPEKRPKIGDIVTQITKMI